MHDADNGVEVVNGEAVNAEAANVEVEEGAWNML